MSLLVGTSGWQYKHWDRRFYPSDLAKGKQLARYAELFGTVEVNATFYRLPEAEVFVNWERETPADFVFVVKASRFLTHMKKLKDPEEPVARLMERARGLGGKLGAVLLQLPPQMRCDPGRLDAALALLSAWAPVAVEFREGSWYCSEVESLLARHGAALCLADRGAQPLTPLWRTADWGYLRFHGGAGSPPGCYQEETLDAWAARAAELWAPGATVYAFFNNDWYLCALRDAALFARLAERRGLAPTRTPEAEGILVG
jgi:uncharacterized protein YecE (DUF72 family)